MTTQKITIKMVWQKVDKRGGPFTKALGADRKYYLFYPANPHIHAGITIDAEVKETRIYNYYEVVAVTNIHANPVDAPKPAGPLSHNNTGRDSPRANTETPTPAGRHPQESPEDAVTRLYKQAKDIVDRALPSAGEIAEYSLIVSDTAVMLNSREMSAIIREFELLKLRAYGKRVE